MISTSIQGKNLDEIFSLLESGEIEMAEIRLDRCPLSEDGIEELFSATDVPLIATCRLAEDALAERKILRAISSGAAFADIEIEVPAVTLKRIRSACREWGTRLIISFHDFNGTPSAQELERVLATALSSGADIVKIVTTALSQGDLETLYGLYGKAPEGRLIAFAMGQEGKPSRLECLAHGAPFTYAALSEGEAAAPGQWPFALMKKALYGGSPVKPLGPVTLRMPASKSFAQRAILAAALADGESVLTGYTPCDDSEAAIKAAEALGARVLRDGATLRITGGKAPVSELFVGESGLLTRLLIPIVAARGSNPVRIDGEKTILGRPLSGAHDVMAAFGVSLRPEKAGARKTDCYLPLTVCGPIIPGKAEIDGRSGSQLISGLLMALPMTADRSTLYVTGPKSIPYLFITLDVMKKFGVVAGCEMEGDENFAETRDWGLCSGITFKIKGGQAYKAASFEIEGDWSGAACFLAAGAIGGDVTLEGLDSSSLQADISIMDILAQAGASLSVLEDGSVHVQHSPLEAFSADLNNCPDLFPVAAVLAAFCKGRSVLSGVERLRHKESDRAEAILNMLGKMGVDIRIDEDIMTIHGIGLSERILTGRLLRGGAFTSGGDHRMVMALRLASLYAESPVIIDDEGCVSKSFPDFYLAFTALASCSTSLP
ncbi:MAG: 3-phosphoshikimate 1-carboxyvinyltransferase [Bacteroidales bacterium]|nr:3-phosphoshikimate 1-carboxyvinyltransferase [Bacteroidales bacterium]